MPAPTDLIELDYAAARGCLLDGDIVLVRGSSWYSPFLRFAGRSPYTHAGMVAWWHGRAHMLQAVWPGDPKPLLSLVARQTSGRLDVFRCHKPQPYTRGWIVHDMITIVGRGYSWGCLARVGLRHLPLIGLFCGADDDDRVGRTARAFCSHAVAWSYNNNLIDLVPNLSDRSTEPGDLARSALLSYQFTITTSGAAS